LAALLILWQTLPERRQIFLKIQINQHKHISKATMLTTFTKRMAMVCLASTALLGSLTSCQKTEISVEEKETTSAERIGELQRFVSKQTGVPVQKIYFDKAYQEFVVDKDLGLDLKDVERRYAAAPTPSANGTDQKIYDYIVSRSNATDIKIYVDATVPAEWISAIDQAIANWNSVNSLIYMRRVTGGTAAITSGTTTGGVALANTSRRKKTTTTTNTNGTTTTTTTDGTTTTTTTTTTSTGTTTGSTGSTSTTGTTTPSIPVYNILINAYYDNTTSTVAYAYMPDWSGGAGFSMSINTAFNYLNSAQKIFAMVHELGHNIGFTHTDGSYGTLVPGTPSTDAQSVMNSFVGNWVGFSNYDQVATHNVYPR
jgi:hypothetical protein